MTEAIQTAARDGIVTITMDDGKVNALSIPVLQALHDAVNDAVDEGRALVLTGRDRVFSAGFDLQTFMQGPEATLEMIGLGAALAVKLMTAPLPVVTACNGNSIAMGALLLLAADYRIGVAGAYKIGLNETAVGLIIPGFAVELARQRLSPAMVHRCLATAELFDPEVSCREGFLDELVPAAGLPVAARERARAMAGFKAAVFAGTKAKLNGPAITAMQRVIDSEMNIDYVRQTIEAGR